MCTARPSCSVAGRSSCRGDSPDALRSADTRFAAKVVGIALDWVDAALALALELVVQPWVLQRALAASLLPVG